MTASGSPSWARRPSAMRVPLEHLTDAFPFAFLITDANGLILEANPAAAELFGRQQQFLTGKPIAALTPVEYKRTVRSAIASVRAERAPFTWQQQVLPLRGEPIAVEISAIPLAPPQAERVAWVIVDAREQVAMERRLRTVAGELEARVLERTEELERERGRLTAVVSQVPAGLVIVDADGDLVTVNDEALRILRVDGLPTGSALWRWEGWATDGTPYAPEDWPLVRSNAGGEVVSGERIEVKAGDGSRIVLDISSAPVRDAAGRSIGAAAVFTDVTTRERRERVEREFVTNAAHELQSPLAALVSAVEVLMVGAKDAPERDLFLAHIARAAERLTRIVRALLVLARAEAGGENPFVELVEVEPMLSRIARELRPASGVEVRVEAEPGIGVLTNAELLEQAVSNLGHNAVKYTTTGEVVLRARGVDGSVEIAVSDTGPGIPSAERGRAFDRFYRGGAGEGAGLGLSIVRAAMDALDGDVELDSTVGVGTIVKLRVPKATKMIEA